jgi:hypothetical protein
MKIFLGCLVFDEKVTVNGLESCFPAVYMTKKFGFAENFVVLKISEKFREIVHVFVTEVLLVFFAK